MSQGRLARRILALMVGCLFVRHASAGNEANFVLYDHHTDEKGETEVNVFGDFSNAVGDEPRYSAQLFEIERALTDRWEAALYLEGDKIKDEDYQFGGLRLESRYRLFDYGVFLNPVLYVEYENLNPEHKYLLDVTGRTDMPDGPEKWEHEIESKLIVGHDITNKFDVAFNWINESNLDTGRWEFGYALGFNYALVGEANQEAEEHEAHGHARKGSGWEIKEVKLGGELYGGLGDSTLGLTLDPNVTQQYAGLNLKTEWANGLHLMVGGTAGLTKESEGGLLRLMLGYEFE
jgi:hypothetical protein